MTKILVADDNPQNLYLLEMLLKAYGYEVIPAGNGAVALDLARKNPPDLAITDILMPDMDGFELCRHWKSDKRLKHVPFIFYTAHYTDGKDEQFALNLGAERFIIKPQQPEVLIQMVNEVLKELAQGKIDSPARPPQESKEMMAQYSEALFRQLEKKMIQLENEISVRKQTENQLKERLIEIEELKQRLEWENVCLQEEVNLIVERSEIVGQSPAMKKVLSQAEQVAHTDSTVLILGETGTGKELLAREIHRMSSRKARPLFTVNCASLPPTLIESELFGRERGAYTGALTKMTGRFEISDGSTLFLDEISEIPLELQSKLLRVLEEGSFERLGSTKTLHVDVRIIAATNQDLDKEVQEGRFRKDLFYRLNVFPIVIPPLSERTEDIPYMVWTFIKEFQKKMGKKIESISKKDMELLQSYSWPGNVRELKNVIERSMIMSTDKTLIVQTPKFVSSKTPQAHSLEDMERRHIVSMLEKHGWRVGGKGGAAEVLGLKRSTLYSKMKKLGIHRPDS